MKFLFRLIVALFTMAIVLLVAGILLVDRVVKEVMIERLHTATGLEVEIGHIDVGLLTPTLTIENFRLYNNTDFGGDTFLDMPELHIEYDPAALRSRNFHLKLLRLNLADITIVQNKKGRLNLEELDKKKKPEHEKSYFDRFKFTGIDTLNLTLGKMQVSNRANGRSEEIDFGIKNQIFHNVKTEGDLAGLSVIMATRTKTLSNTNSVIDVPALLKNLTGQ